MTEQHTHRCPARGCPREVQAHLLMCGLHWRMVPRRLQRAVTEAWRCGTDLRALLTAQRDAINAVNDLTADQNGGN